MDWIEKGNSRALCEGGIHQRGCCAKSITGDQSASRESLTADGRQPLGTEAIRVGDARVLPNQSKFMPNMSKVYTTAGDSVVALDPFLHDDEGRAGRVGGEDRGYSPADPNHGKGGGSYVYVEPDVDARGEENFRASEESGIADAAQFRPATPGLVGGREPSSYVVKRGTFRSVLDDPSNASGFGEQR